MHYPTNKNVPNLHKLGKYRIMKMQWQRVVVFSIHSCGTKKQKAQPKIWIILHQQCTTAFPLFQEWVLAESKE